MPKIQTSFHDSTLEIINTAMGYHQLSDWVNEIIHFNHENAIAAFEYSELTYQDFLAVFDSLNGYLVNYRQLSSGISGVDYSLVGEIMEAYEYESIDEIPDELDRSHHLVPSRKATLNRLNNLSTIAKRYLPYISAYWWGLKDHMQQEEFLLELLMSSASDSEQYQPILEHYLRNHPDFNNYEVAVGDIETDMHLNTTVRQFVLKNTHTDQLVIPLHRHSEEHDDITQRKVIFAPISALENIHLGFNRNSRSLLFVSDGAFDALSN